MVDRQFIDELKKRLTDYEAGRRDIIKQAGDALSLSKRSIFALHRDDSETAGQLLAQAGTLLAAVREAAATNPDLADEGSYRAALEEYYEARLYEQWLATGDIKRLAGEPDEYRTYIGALSDLTGEIQRRQVRLASAGELTEVQRLKDDIESVVGYLLDMDLGGHLRQKFDQAKNNLRRAEDVLYEVTIRQVR
jgi:predicted translin family RNA/ssDNA-binding protein